jgi:predicted DNA-binding ribbon-helix-helix protein
MRISGRNTGVSLEDAFWEAFGEIAISKGTTRPELLAKIDKERSAANLSSAVRLFILAHYRRGGQIAPKILSENQRGPSPISKRSIKIAGHPTSVSLEPAFWDALKEIAAARELTINELVAMIDKGRQSGNLSSAIRVFVLAYYRDQRS